MRSLKKAFIITSEYEIHVCFIGNICYFGNLVKIFLNLRHMKNMSVSLGILRYANMPDDIYMPVNILLAGIIKTPE